MRPRIPGMDAETAMTLPSTPGTIRIPPKLAVLLACLLLAGIALSLLDLPDPALTRLQVEGDFRHVSAQQVRETVEPLLLLGFFGTDIEAIKDVLIALPWVARVRVERAWPRGLRVRLWEREPYARWNESQLLDTTAIPFQPAPSELPDALPQLGGIAGHERDVMSTYQRLVSSLSSTPFALTGLQLDPRGEWMAQTRAGIELRLGQGQPDEKIPMIVGAVTTTLAGRYDDVAYVDLRYSNGFAVGWRQPPVVEGGKK